jgi:hypothetical protein
MAAPFHRNRGAAGSARVTAATIAFWERRGFVQIDTIDPLPRMATGQRPGDLRSGSQADMGKGTEI